ncbi:MAG: motility protein A [Bacteroidetes bacterium]|nr:motility protein A [Rhodothermia bacterium]MCS7154435.1 motility protein A [Bacteroidota bacterium]MCX7906808.1 motility protein A [Bacteroidota bacterium]MDW8136913.1 motility protein A [Bacteroidota bacterium]MDW8285217.1 motility protein A [Bacteroidota bacterium]
MDLSTLIGIVGGLGLIGASILMGSGFSVFVDIPSAIIVLGGTMAGTLVSFPLSKVLGVLKVVKKTLFHQEVVPARYIEQFVELARKARRDGLLSIDRELDSIQDPFMRSGLEMAVDGMDAEAIAAVLQNELDNMTERHKAGQRILQTMGSLAPAFGMIGTLIGLVQMLQNLNDPDQVGPAMAVALITTFYGALLANLFFIPMTTKLKERSAEEVYIRSIILEGVLAIVNGDNPRIVEMKLMRYLPPAMRQRLAGGEAAAELKKVA